MELLRATRSLSSWSRNIVSAASLPPLQKTQGWGTPGRGTDRKPKSEGGPPATFRPLELQGVRRVLVPKFPKHLLFYRFTAEEVFVLRVVHGARDLEGLFS